MINIAKILENTPKGLKLYSPICGECELRCVSSQLITVVDCEDGMYNFGIYGEKNVNGECLLFPSKDRRTWENWQDILFQCGDVIVSQNETPVGFQTFLCYKNDDRGYLAYGVDGGKNYITPSYYRYATSEEHKQFMAELNANGYKWNADTKQIEKIEQQYTPKYKVGDYIIHKETGIHISKITGFKFMDTLCYEFSDKGYLKQDYVDIYYRLATEQELIDAGIKNQLHKFKAGDVIRNKETGIVHRIIYPARNWYILYQYNDEGMTGLNYENEDKWELVTEPKSESHYATSHREFFDWIFDRLVNVHGENPNVDYMQSLKERIDDLFPETEETGTTSEPTEEKSFTIEDLKPFDKVLVKYDSYSKWGIDFFERYDYNSKNNTPGPYICLSSSTHYCIPYNDETKHLLGTTDDCPKKYKTWED